MILMGIDPGLASTGVGVIARRGEGWRLVHAAEARTSSTQPLAERLLRLHDLVASTIAAHHPEALAVEAVFFAKNVKSAVAMAHGRGAALLAAAQAGVPVHEYSALEIKQSVLGSGRATKLQVMQMVKVLLGLPGLPESDHQADALAAALAHAYRSRLARTAAESLDGEDDPRAYARQVLARAGRRRKRRR